MVGYSSLRGFRLPFTPIFSGLPINPTTFWAIICTENLYPLDLDIDGIDPLQKTLNCFNPGFRLPFLGIYAEWWDIGALLLLWKVGILESWNFRIF